MRKIHKERLKGAIGILCILFAIVLFIGWETYGREAFTYKTVLVMNQDVKKGTIIDKSMLGLMKEDSTRVIPNGVTDPNKIIGKKTTAYIPRGLQLCGKWFSDPGLATGNGSYIFNLPMDWTFSYPQTIRRGDTLYFYAIDKSLVKDGIQLSELDLGTPILSAKAAYVKDSANREVVDVKSERIDGSAAISEIELVITDKKYEILKQNVEAGKVFILMYE